MAPDAPYRPDPEPPAPGEGTPMFEHLPVGRGRHVRAVAGAAAVGAGAQAAIGASMSVAAMSMAGKAVGPQAVAAAAIVGVLLWSWLFVIVLAEYAVAFTATRAVLTAARRNVGAAYPAMGLVIGLVEAAAIGMASGTPPRDSAYGAALGALGGFTYWLLAARGRRTAVRTQADMTAVFG